MGFFSFLRKARGRVRGGISSEKKKNRRRGPERGKRQREPRTLTTPCERGHKNLCPNRGGERHVDDKGTLLRGKMKMLDRAL